MEHLHQLIQTDIAYAPYLIFGALLLAGFNIPVSEDAMLFISAMLATNRPDDLPRLFVAVYMGAYLSDLICYCLGRVLGPKLFKIRFLANMASKERVEKIHGFYERYGWLTLLLGRFIPFGVRNGLFLSAGFSKMSFPKFALADLTACTITTTIYFSLYYQYGESVINTVKASNKLIAITTALMLATYFLVNKLKKNRKPKPPYN